MPGSTKLKPIMPAAPASPPPPLAVNRPHFSPQCHTSPHQATLHPTRPHFWREKLLPKNLPCYLTVESLPLQWQLLIDIVTGLHQGFACAIGSDSTAGSQMLTDLLTTPALILTDTPSVVWVPVTMAGNAALSLMTIVIFQRFYSFDDSCLKNSQLQCCQKIWNLPSCCLSAAQSSLAAREARLL